MWWKLEDQELKANFAIESLTKALNYKYHSSRGVNSSTGVGWGEGERLKTHLLTSAQGDVTLFWPLRAVSKSNH